MSQPGPRQTKRQKKALAFRTRQKKNRNLDDEDAFGFPIDENQDLVGLADLPLEAAEVPAGGTSGSQKGKAEDDGRRQAQSTRSKKRKREGEEVAEEKSQKRSKVNVRSAGVKGGDVEEKVEAKKRAQPQRFILFIGVFPPSLTSENKSHV